MWIAMALLSTGALAQLTPTPAVSLSPSPTPKSAAETIVDQVAAAVRSGHLAVDVSFRPGKSPMMESWSLETVGAPTAHLTVDAAEGRVQSLDYHVDGGDLVFVGRGLRPSVVVSEISVDASGKLRKAVFHGRGIVRPIVALFRPLVLSSLGKIRFHTEVAELFRGNLIVGGEANARAAAARTPAEASPSAALDLVAGVRISDSTIGLFEDRHLDIGPSLFFETARDPEGHDPLVLKIESATYRPARGSDVGELAMRGALDCRLKNGQLAFNDGRLAFATGRLAAARFEIARGESGALETKLSASRLALLLTSGRYRGPAGVVVDLAEGSRFELADLAMTPAGSVSGTLDAALLGKTGEISRQGSRIALSDVRVVTKGLKLSENRATGEMSVDFEYRLRYPFVVKYPVESLKERRVPLDFSGPLSARLHLEDVGAGQEGTVTGTYTFTAPWEPIEKAAFEAIRAQWEQNAPVIERVSLSVDPTAFRPCGKGCFYTKFRFVAEKRQKKKSIFREECGPEGKADLVIDKDARAFILSNVRIRPECKGIVGWVVNLIAPLLTKTYNDMVLFKMPEDLPFTIETVDGDEQSITLTGSVRWAAAGHDATTRAGRSVGR
jgi:hypothetical protein